MRYGKEPYELKAKWKCYCKETKKEIKKGEWCVYYPSERNIFSMESKTGYDFRLWKEDIMNGHNY